MATGRSRQSDAESLAYSLLRELPQRWRHTRGVAARASEIAPTVAPDERDTLMIAAWLHDIGYNPRIAIVGYHPIDGAVHLAARGWPARICALVAHHSGADYVAAAAGLTAQLTAFAREESAVADALTYADQTTGPQGQPMAVGDRIADMLDRHGPESAQARAAADRTRYVLAVTDRVERRLHSHQETAGSTGDIRPIPAEGR